MSKVRKTYSASFKRDAVSLLTKEGYTLKAASENLGVSQSALMKWKNRYGKISSSELGVEVELKQLRTENRRLKMEREILKKAAAFFAKENL